MRLVILTAFAVLTGCRIGFDNHGDVVGMGDATMGDASISTRVCTGYTRIGTLGTTFRMLTSRPWLTAEQACEADGTHLAIVEDFTEEEAIRLQLGTTAWIGTTDRITEGTFLHVSGAVPTYTNWNTAIDNAGEDCASILGTGKWEDQDCSISLAAICECDDVGVVAGSY